MTATCTPESFDAEYVRRLSEGDTEAERQFVNSFEPILTLKLRSRLRTRHAVEDVRQETYARIFSVLKCQGGLIHPERFSAFVHSVCNNVLLEFYRSDRRIQQLPAEEYEPADAGPGVESMLVSAERKARVRHLVSTLSAKDQEVLRLLFYEELDKDDVCRRLHVDREYLRVLVHRATTKLREKCSA